VQQRPTNSEIVILVAGAVMLIGSFLDWFSFAGEGLSSWSSGMFPLATLVPIIGVVMALQVALTRFANVDLPERVADFTWTQVHLILAVWAVVMAACWMIRDTGGPDRGIGLFLNFLGAIALVVGAIMMRNERPAGGGNAFGT
jgi:hypothetical protein